MGARLQAAKRGGVRGRGLEGGPGLVRRQRLSVNAQGVNDASRSTIEGHGIERITLNTDGLLKRRPIYSRITRSIIVMIEFYTATATQERRKENQPLTSFDDLPVSGAL